MIKLEHTEVLGWEHAIRGMRNPKNSWERSDSCSVNCVSDPEDYICNTCPEYCDCDPDVKPFYIGPNDHDLMMRLAKGGPVHAKYRRMIVVYVDITAPLYWWKEFDTYKVGTVANSCSTMHKIADKEFTLEDFSHEHLLDVEGEAIEFDNAPGDYWNSMALLDITVRVLNMYRERYLETKDKRYWWQMIQLLPSSYNQRRTVMLNYEVLAGIYPMRKDHKLDEWHTFCDWIEPLPYSEIITGQEQGFTSKGMYELGKKLQEGFEEGFKRFAGCPASRGLSFNDQRELCGLPPISHEEITPDTVEMLKKELNIVSPSEASPTEKSQKIIFNAVNNASLRASFPELYLCDRKRCGDNCTYPICMFTTDKEHEVKYPPFEKEDHNQPIESIIF